MLKKDYGGGREGEGQISVGVRDVLGYLLIFGGVAIAIWVLVNVHGIFTQPEKLTPFQELVSSQMEARINYSKQEQVRLVVPAEFLSYLVPLILLLIAAGISGSFFTGGIRLLTGKSMQHLSRKLTEISSDLNSRLDRIERIQSRDSSIS